MWHFFPNDFQYGQDSDKARVDPQFLTIKAPSMLLPNTATTYRKDEELYNTLCKAWTSFSCQWSRLDYPAHSLCISTASSFTGDTLPLKWGVLPKERTILPAPGRAQREQWAQPVRNSYRRRPRRNTLSVYGINATLCKRFCAEQRVGDAYEKITSVLPNYKYNYKIIKTKIDSK